MNTLTCAELLAYPGGTFTEQVRSHYKERSPAPAASSVAARKSDGALKPLSRGHGALPIGKRIDIRRFTGRDRVDRIANYLRAMVPRATTWSEESLRGLAERLLTTARNRRIAPSRASALGLDAAPPRGRGVGARWFHGLAESRRHELRPALRRQSRQSLSRFVPGVERQS